MQKKSVIGSGIRQESCGRLTRSSIMIACWLVIKALRKNNDS